MFTSGAGQTPIDPNRQIFSAFMEKATGKEGSKFIESLRPKELEVALKIINLAEKGNYFNEVGKGAKSAKFEAVKLDLIAKTGDEITKKTLDQRSVKNLVEQFLKGSQLKERNEASLGDVLDQVGFKPGDTEGINNFKEELERIAPEERTPVLQSTLPVMAKLPNGEHKTEILWIMAQIPASERKNFSAKMENLLSEPGRTYKAHVLEKAIYLIQSAQTSLRSGDSKVAQDIMRTLENDVTDYKGLVDKFKEPLHDFEADKLAKILSFPKEVRELTLKLFDPSLHPLKGFPVLLELCAKFPEQIGNNVVIKDYPKKGEQLQVQDALRQLFKTTSVANSLGYEMIVKQFEAK